MRTAVYAALLAACLALATACPEVVYHSCVKEEKPPKCKAIQVCEDSYKEPCGDSYCEYPYTCATLQKEECKTFELLKEKCEAKKKVCKEVLIPCGDGACGLHQDCVKETVCSVSEYGYGRKLLNDGYQVKVYGGCGKPQSTCGGGPALVCEDKYTCVAKEPCEEVTVKKCVESVLTPDIDVCDGGFDFLWAALNEGETCGDEYCGFGYECAEVKVQKCTTPCGDSECPYGQECVPDDEEECANYPYLKTVCRDTYEPVCIPLSPYCQINYKPPCKTVYKCEIEESCCGNSYCPAGYVCAVDSKPSCDSSYVPAKSLPVVSDPVSCDPPKFTLLIKPQFYRPPSHYQEPEPHYGGGYKPEAENRSTAVSTSYAAAEDDVSVAKGEVYTTGEGVGAANAAAETENSFAGVEAFSSKEGAGALTGSFATEGGKAFSFGKADHRD